MSIPAAVYRDIRRLPAGYLVNFSNHTSNVRCFLKLPIEEPLQLKRPEEYLEAYRALLMEAVNDRLPQNAAALYLRGGLDSATVCAVAGRIASPRGTERKAQELWFWDAVRHPFRLLRKYGQD
jgi:asparagine synthetase B (glutamine-hydrolysing)